MLDKRKEFNLNRGINRNIVECKSACIASATSQAIGINRNIVECKYRKK